MTLEAKVNTTHCCEMMTSNVSHECEIHQTKYECPDVLIDFREKSNTYSIIIHDGGTSGITIKYCPWCGQKLDKK